MDCIMGFVCITLLWDSVRERSFWFVLISLKQNNNNNPHLIKCPFYVWINLILYSNVEKCNFNLMEGNEEWCQSETRSFKTNPFFFFYLIEPGQQTQNYLRQEFHMEILGGSNILISICITSSACVTNFTKTEKEKELEQCTRYPMGDLIFSKCFYWILWQS